MSLPMIIADFESSLAAKIAVGGTTGVIISNVDDDGVTLPDGVAYFTLDGNNSAKEHIKCTKTGTALSDIYSVSRQGVETSGTVREHRVGAKVIMTDYATYKNYFEAAVGDMDGPASSTDNAIARFDGTTGKLLQDSGFTVGDITGNGITMSTPAAATPTFTVYQAGATLTNDTNGAQNFLKGGSGLGSGAGGLSELLGGNAGATGAGGPAVVQGGAGGATSGDGGAAIVRGGDGKNVGGTVSIIGGSATDGDTDGGYITLSPGVGHGTGSRGLIRLYPYLGATYDAILNLDSIASSSKVFTFPNKSGTFAMTSDVGANAMTIETTAGVTHSLTTTAGQKVIVWAKGGVTAPLGSPGVIVSLKYNNVTKDSLTLGATDQAADAADAFALMYTETPGADTQNITVVTSAGSLSDVVIIVQIIG
jgi:hypothetical protein